ncbi:hypothetical protein F4777DRAFT_40891 [Nemania sp. FL0916]|nr:hypothetical protein F4777DRAFT_40891 [Nemania sp. FL0916]
MLLTASQASVLITSAMVLLCTSALFISGCLIQQRTLRDLRSAIRPVVVTRPKPKVWAVDDLRRTTTVRLTDGSVVRIQPDDNAVAENELDASSDDTERGEDVVEIRPTLPDEDENELVAAQKPLVQERPRSEDEDREGDSNGDGDGLSVGAAWDGVQENGETLSRAERRRRIKAEIQRLSHGDTPVYYQRRLW